jgi:uncharacterized Zn finger protein
MHITLPCPSCGEKCEHLLVDESRNPVVRCTVCGHTHRGVPPKEKEIQVRVILAAECGDEASGVEVTSIESKGKRVKKARARDVSTLWTRAIDQVVVRASVHKGWVTSPVSVVCEGGEEFSVGESWTFGPLPFRITHMKLRNGKVLRKDGQRAPARSVKRIYGNRL